MIELVILGMLKDSPLHGYELRRRVRQQLGMFTRASFGSLYPALGRLLSIGAVKESIPTANKLSIPTGSLSAEKAIWKSYGSKVPAMRNSKSKRIYEITPKGERLLDELLNNNWDSEDAKSFLVRIAFGKYLSNAARLKLLRNRVAFVEKTIEELQEELKNLKEDETYLRAIKTRFLVLSLAEQQWLSELIKQEIESEEKVEVKL